jgi:IS5 family transposase
MMFKILVIQAMDNLSDERAEFFINDRMSFMRFPGLGLADRVPDARTIWLFREKRTKAGAIEPLFARFDGALRASGYIAMSGQIVDATLVPAPKQRNTEEEKKAIKEGRIPEAWAERSARLRQKDRDARWTVKFSKAKERPDGTKQPVDIAIPTFGYQNHVAIDRGFGFIRKWSATDAAAYEGARLREGLLDKTNTASSVWADTAYRSAANEEFMQKNGFVSRVHRKKPKGKPMPDATRRANAEKSKVRSRVEHVFAAQKDRMGLFVRTIGIARTRVKIGMANLVYNFKRLVFWRKTVAA